MSDNISRALEQRIDELRASVNWEDDADIGTLLVVCA
jgi:hypothetical protein